MTKGRPFTDPNFNPPGRPFSDPIHPNYDWFNGGEVTEFEGDPAQDKGLPATTEPPAGEEILLTDSGLNGLINETPVDAELAVANTFALLPEDEIIGAVDSLMPTISGTEDGEKIKGTNGDDIFEGGLGADKFKVKKGDDIILDFQVGEDSLQGKFKDIELSPAVGDVGGTLMEHKSGSVLFEGLDLTAVDIFG